MPRTDYTFRRFGFVHVGLAVYEAGFMGLLSVLILSGGFFVLLCFSGFQSRFERETQVGC